MPGSVHVIARSARSDKRYPRRFLVRYRRGGRYFKIEHAGSFKTTREATERRNLVAGWLAAGLDPREELAKLTVAPSTKPLAQWADDWLTSRVDAAPKTVKSYRCGIECLRRSEIGSALPASITPADVVGWITENSALAPASLKLYRMVLAQVLDYALPEGAPNPARHRSVKLPRLDRVEVEPPSAAEFLALLERVPPRSRLPLADVGGRGRCR